MAREAIEVHKDLYNHATKTPSRPGTNSFFEQLAVLEEHRQKTQDAVALASRCRQAGQLLKLLELRRDLLTCEESYSRKQHTVELERIKLHVEKNWARTIIDKFRNDWRYFNARVEAGESQLEAKRSVIGQVIERGSLYHMGLINDLEISVKAYEDDAAECRKRLKDLRRAWSFSDKECVG